MTANEMFYLHYCPVAFFQRVVFRIFCLWFQSAFECMCFVYVGDGEEYVGPVKIPTVDLALGLFFCWRPLKLL